MSSALRLVPKSDDTDIVDKYYKGLAQKGGEVIPNRDWSDYTKLPGYKLNLNRPNSDAPVILEELPSRLFKVIDTNELHSFFGEYNQGQVSGEDLNSLVELLRNTKKKLRADDEYTTNPEMSIELGPVWLCEFARQHGHSVELSQ